MKTVAVDPDIILRILTGEPEDDARRAFASMKSLLDEGVQFLLPGAAVLVMVEHLEAHTGASRTEIAKGILDFLTDFRITVPERLYLAALTSYGESGLPLRDAIMFEQMRLEKAEAILSFDAAWDGRPGVERLAP